MKVNCISCGHKVDLDQAYDDYDGIVKCFICGAILEIRTEQGNVKAVGLANASPHTPPSGRVKRGDAAHQPMD